MARDRWLNLRWWRGNAKNGGDILSNLFVEDSAAMQRGGEEDRRARPFNSFLTSWPSSAFDHKFSSSFRDTMIVNFTRLYQAAFKGDLAGKWASKMSTGGATAVGGKVSYSTLRKSLRPIDVEDRFGRDMIIRHSWRCRLAVCGWWNYFRGVGNDVWSIL